MLSGVVEELFGIPCNQGHRLSDAGLPYKIFFVVY